jgi:hypothetical protein
VLRRSPNQVFYVDAHSGVFLAIQRATHCTLENKIHQVFEKYI